MGLAAEFLLWLLILFTNHNPIYSRLWYNMFPHRPFFFLIYDLLALLATLLSLTNLKTNAVKWKGKNHPVQSVSYLFCMIRILIYWRPGISFQYPHFSTLNSLNWLPTIPLSAIIDDGWPYNYTTKYSALLQQVPQTGKVILNFIKPPQSHRQSPLHILSDNTTQHYQGKESHFYASFFLDIPLFSCSNEVTMSSPFYSSPDYSKTYKTHKPDLWVQIYTTCI